MRISVVTPNYNMGHYLEETMQSVIRNLRPRDEYFVIDGGSTDRSVELIRRHATSLTGWVSEPDQGYADALAKGFERASGDVLCWINAGDVLLSGAFDAARAAMAQTEADLIFGDDFYIDEHSRVISFSRGFVPDLRAAMLYGGWTPLQDACFWRRKLYLSVGGMDRNLKYAADYDLFLRMALAGRAEYVPCAFSAFRRHAGQKSIVGADNYKRERQRVRLRALLSAKGATAYKWFSSVTHWFSMRWRARVLQRWWRRPELKGISIAHVRSGPYWPRPKEIA